MPPPAAVTTTIVFFPVVTSLVVAAMLWQLMYNKDLGLIQSMLSAFGLHHNGFLSNPTLALPSIVVMMVWKEVGFSTIIFVAGLKGIPSELYDAARIDGAGWWASLRNVTLPMMSPVIFYSLILGIVDVLQYFLVPLVLYNGTGEPGGSTLFFNLVIYKQAFNFQNFSYGATLAWLLFGITLAITLVVFRTSRRWVYYAGER